MMDEDLATGQEVEEIRLARERGIALLNPLQPWQRKFVLSYLREKMIMSQDDE